MSLAVPTFLVVSITGGTASFITTSTVSTGVDSSTTSGLTSEVTSSFTSSNLTSLSLIPFPPLFRLYYIIEIIIRS